MRYLSTRCFAPVTLLIAMILCIDAGCTQQQQEAQQPQEVTPQQMTFDSPIDANDALIKAVRDWSPQKFQQILGTDADDVLMSGDDVADHTAAERFLKAYDEKHVFSVDENRRITLVVGNNEWPMPIPIVQDENKKWYFDSEAGKDEIVNRRIGRNELDVIEVCQAIADAQREYAMADHNSDGIREYAQKIVSDEGKQNGLFWPTPEGQPPSPLGPLVAAAVEEGYSASANTTDQPRPYHGYCYHMLKLQGPHAPGGQMDYVINGHMIGGFAVVAYPADYGNSGITTFMISQQGIVYQKDLGDDTEKLAKAIDSFDPDAGWEPVATDVASSSPTTQP